MCKRIKRILLPFLFTLAVVFTSTVIVYADVQLNKTDNLLSSQYSIDTYNSYMDSTKGFWGFLVGDTQSNMIHGVTNILYSLQKIAWGFVDSALKFMFEADALKELTVTITELTNQLWGVFRNNYVPLVIVISLCMIGMTFVLKSSQQAIKQLGKLMFVLFLSMTWFANGQSILNTFNDFSANLQADIMASAGKTDFMNDIDTTDGDMTDSVTVIRNLYFDQVVQKPYYLMNYGTASAKEIEENSDFGNPSDLLRESSNEESSESIKQTYEKQSENNPFLTPDKVTYKFTVAFFASLTLVLYSIPLFVIAFCNLLLQLGALLMYYVLPLLALISLIPQYSNAIINGVVKVIQLLLMKAILGLGILVVSLLTLVVDTLFSPTIIAMFLLNMVVKGLTLVISWKYRDKIIRVITNNLVQAASPKIINENMAKAKNKVEEKVSNIWNNRGTHDVNDGYERVSTNDPDMVMHLRAEGARNSAFGKRTEQKNNNKENRSSEESTKTQNERWMPKFERASQVELAGLGKYEFSPDSKIDTQQVVDADYVQVNTDKFNLFRKKQKVEIEPEYQQVDPNLDIPDTEIKRQKQVVDQKINTEKETMDQSFEKPSSERLEQEIDLNVKINKQVDEVQTERTMFKQEDISLHNDEPIQNIDRKNQESEEKNA